MMRLQYADRLIVERVAAIAEKRGVPRAQIATCLVAAERTSNSSNYRCYEISHLEDAVAALRLR